MGWEENRDKRNERRDRAYSQAYKRMSRDIQKERTLDLVKKIAAAAPLALMVGTVGGCIAYWVVTL